MTRDKGLLTGAWLVMAAVGAYSYWKISESPKVDPTIVKLCTELAKAQSGQVTGCQGPPPVSKPKIPICTDPLPGAGLAYIEPEADLFRTKFVGIPIDPKPKIVQVLPFPVMGTVKATLDGTRVTWSTEERKVELKTGMIRKEAKPSAFAVFRQIGEETPQKLADLGPEARSYADLSAEPLRTYRYWVTLTGQENLRTTYADADKFMTVTNETDGALSDTGPSASRVRLVGGDRSHAVLKVENYYRPGKSWVGKTLLVNPGETVAGTVWSLKKLRFDNFTLVADLTDDAGVDRVLTTRE
jgi:hypothetical protein